MSERRRGAVRSESARLAVLDATATLFVERGYENLTIEGVAATAGVAKQTIYRWWHSKSELVAECLIEGRLLPSELRPLDTGDIRADMTAWLDNLFRFADAPGNSTFMLSLVTAAADNEATGRLLNDALGASSLLTGRLTTAVTAGNLPAETPVQEVAQALVGAVVVHVLQRAPASPGSAERLVRAVLR
ncbi:TetR/AcrR family transcriptional regulator [Actinotalea subterranea]|uniref:TetR/AcrR family transcriptional regulator n=1 Tax=Actinotalea subterranea TaxID=2607497 RepID=UPI0011EF49FB|nr:TetR/AcrR family transcriptional regulator [Actinotalea subterranea]